MTARGVLNDRPVFFDEEEQCWRYEDDQSMVINAVKPAPTRFGTLLLSARKSRGLSQDNAAELTGVSNCYISQMETGKWKNPTATILIKLHRGYKLPYDSMLDAIEADNA